MAEDIKDEIVLNDDELICVLTGNKKKANAKELMLHIIRKTKCSPLFKRSDISCKTKRPPKNNFPQHSKDSKKSIGKFCFSRCFFL